MSCKDSEISDIYLLADRDDSRVPPDGERSGRYKGSTSKEEMIFLSDIMPVP